MPEQRNIVILGGSVSGLQSAHYILKHLLPSLNAKHEAQYHVFLINPSPDYYFRIAAPRTAVSTSRLPAEKIFFDIEEAFKKYPSNNFTFLQGAATGLDTTARTITYKRSEYLGDEQLSYHALIVATGSRTFEPAFSQPTDKLTTLNAIKSLNTKLSTAKDVVVVGGGPTGVEVAAEIGELLNGKPGWFSTPEKKANITLITAANHLLHTLSPSRGKEAEIKLKRLGVDVLYNTRVADTTATKDGRTVVTLGKGEKLEVDVYVAAHGVLPNSSFIPSPLLDANGYVKTNPQTLRVDEAGARVYAIGDVASYSRNTILDVYDSFPVAMVNLKRDLFSYNPANPNKKPSGKDRHFTPNKKEMMIVPVGSAGGVGALFGWRAPNWLVWLAKSRDFMVGIGPGPVISGDKVKKEVAWTKEEAVA
ncbi:FAD/NAD(P)-binding domain-containing protein [Lojkania enalia]|uniref:FAD/NAD(P)-binding domain-containing protein n=1 Tax=Lojkania enalia TaxID=147567 RepID=A0A9P4NBA1_9PLEO|nr:FAD/NAD(P)-binding domain-containing protein [Didymosphaeria enalia]